MWSLFLLGLFHTKLKFPLMGRTFIVLHKDYIDFWERYLQPWCKIFFWKVNKYYFIFHSIIFIFFSIFFLIKNWCGVRLGHGVRSNSIDLRCVFFFSAAQKKKTQPFHSINRFYPKMCKTWTFSGKKNTVPLDRYIVFFRFFCQKKSKRWDFRPTFRENPI